VVGRDVERDPTLVQRLEKLPPGGCRGKGRFQFERGADDEERRRASRQGALNYSDALVFNDHRIAVIVPAFGVAAHLPEVLRGLPPFVDHVIVVDDGSPDDLSVVTGVERTEIVRHTTNRGLAAAMVTGLKRALELDVDVIVKMDGDGQMDPAYLPALLEPITSEEADLAKGNRFLRRRHLGGMPAERRAGNLVLSFLTKVASGYWNIFDPTNGYVAIRRQLACEIDLDLLGPRYYFETSLLCEAYLAGAVVRDVPIPARYRDENSGLSLTRTLAEFPLLLTRSFVRRIVLRYFVRDFTPLALFLVGGSLLSGAGLAFGLWNWLERAGTGQPTPTGTIILALLPLLVGFQLLLQAFVMDIGNVPTRSPWRGVRGGGAFRRNRPSYRPDESEDSGRGKKEDLEVAGQAIARRGVKQNIEDRQARRNGPGQRDVPPRPEGGGEPDARECESRPPEHAMDGAPDRVEEASGVRADRRSGFGS
jgi:dolichol-phosphate mannosyltransferase